MGSDATADTVYDAYDPYSTAANKAGYLDAAAQSAAFVNTPVTTTGYNVYPYWLRVTNNDFTNNYASRDHAVLDIRGVPRVHI